MQSWTWKNKEQNTVGAVNTNAWWTTVSNDIEKSNNINANINAQDVDKWTAKNKVSSK